MGREGEVCAFAPASVANVGCGFDIFGFALESPGDQVTARHHDGKGVRLATIRGDQGRLPRAAGENTAGVAVAAKSDSLPAKVTFLLTYSRDYFDISDHTKTKYSIGPFIHGSNPAVEFISIQMVRSNALAKSSSS